VPKKLRVFALLSIVLLVAAACSKPKTQAAQTGGTSKGQSALAGSQAAQGAAKQAKTVGGQQVSVGAQGPAAKGYAALNPAADVAQAKRIGQLIKLQSTSYKTPNTWVGVTKDTIHLDFGMDLNNCGTNLAALLVNAGAHFAKGDRFYRPQPTDQTVINQEQKEAIQYMTQYWNDHVGDVANDVPQAVQVMKKYNTPGHNFYGRKLTYELVDAGSFQCPEKQTSAATYMANGKKTFSAVVYDVPGYYENGYNLAAALKAKAGANVRPMTFGLLDTSDKYLSNFAPYVWDEFQSITKMSKLAASWVCSRLNGRNAANSPQFGGMKRKFGLAWPNNTNANQASSEFQSFVKSDCGMTFSLGSTAFQFNDNPTRAADEGNQIATTFHVNGVTSVIYLIDFFGSLFHLEDFKAQNYHPEIITVATAEQTATADRAYVSQDMVDKALMGYTSFGVQGFGQGGPTDAFWAYHTYHKVSPHDHKACDPRSDAGMMHDASFCRAPGAVDAWYYSWLPLVGGLIFAGPNLTPGTVAAGLQAYPLTRYGVNGPTTDPQAVLVGAGPGQYYFITDGSEYRWRSGYVSPPPESLLGWAEYPDCQRHYLSWPSNLANGWEKGGAAYSAYCGAAKYASASYRGGVAYKPRADSGQYCTPQHPGDSNAPPGGKCETDDYPRWTPLQYR
jgi:hypothetical protein